MAHEEEVNTMLRGFVIVGLIMFSVSVLSASAEMWKDSFDGDELKEEWKPVVSVFGANPPTNWKIENGVLTGRWTTWGQQHLLIEYPSLDYTVQVKCRIDKINTIDADNAAGLIVRSAGPDRISPGQGVVDFYNYGLTPSAGNNGVSMIYIWANGWDYPGRAQKELKIGEWYTLKMVTRGDNLKGYIDDELAFEVNDGRTKGNFVGVFNALYVNASFDDFVVTDEPLASVSPQGTLMTTWAGLKKQ
jgi:hypothetical protein